METATFCCVNRGKVPLRLTAGALFRIYERYGVRGGILQSSGAMEDTQDGYLACLGLAELLAEQAELWRRRQGHTAKDPFSAQDLPDTADGLSWASMRLGIRQAVEQGFARAVRPREDDGEVNLVLAARNDEEEISAARLRISFLTVCAARLHLPPADALLLTPGEYLDMVTLLSGGEEDCDGGPEN